MCTPTPSDRFWQLFDALQGRGPRLEIQPAQRTRFPVVSEWLDLNRLRECWTVWYTANGNRGILLENHRNDAIPTLVGNIADDLNNWPQPVFRSGVEQWERRILSGDQIGPLLAYNLGQGRTLLLDGNHRAIATVRQQQPAQVELLILAGPMDVTVLEDLAPFLDERVP